MNTNIKFSSSAPGFYSTACKRVAEYFKTANINRFSNQEMVWKTVFMFSLYLIPYGFTISGLISSFWVYLGLVAIMGLGKAGIGLSVMHDANHGAYSAKSSINKLLSLSINLVGAHSLNWKIQHNVLHHTYTNVHNADEDISPRGILRMSPDSKWKPIHKFQHFYAWFFYGLMTFVWIIYKDFGRLRQYQKDGMIKKQNASATKQWLILFLTKIVYFGCVIALPFWLTPFSIWQILLGFFVMHYIAGFILALIFQPAHVIEGTSYPVPDKDGNLENNWAIHQMNTTTNFGPRQKLFSWYVGGLNYQVEHHLFPNICHVHYRKLAPIIEKTAKEFGVPYHTKKSFFGAVAAHARLLKTLGARPALLF